MQVIPIRVVVGVDEFVQHLLEARVERAAELLRLLVRKVELFHHGRMMPQRTRAKATSFHHVQRTWGARFAFRPRVKTSLKSARSNTTAEPAPHARAAAEVAGDLETDLVAGLSRDEAIRRLERYGPNTLTARRKQSPLVRLALQFHQPLIYILLAAGVVTAALGDVVDASVILGVVIINALVGFVQEGKAVSAIEALSKTMQSEATVLRGGEPHRLSHALVVPGDLVSLQSGDKVPADMRLAHVRELQIDESALTGESVPVSKGTQPLDPEALLSDRHNMAYASTLVTHGQAKGVVVATGDQTEIGAISALLSGVEDIATPLEKKIARFSRILTYIILAFAAVTIAVAVFIRGQTWDDAFVAAVALVVGAIPEGLPAAMTIILAIGVSRMARRRAIIRNLPAVETLGSTTVICSDKTGTLTENQMTVRRVIAGGEVFDVSGAGYAPEGQFFRGDRPVTRKDAPRTLVETLQCGVSCSDARVVAKDGRYQVMGDPTEGALVVAAEKLGQTREGVGAQGAEGDPKPQRFKQKIEESMPRLDVIPFESERGYMATLHDAGQGDQRVVYLKGGVEKTLEICSDTLGSDGRIVALDRGAVAMVASDMSRTGMRVLAFARKFVTADTRELAPAHVAHGMTFLGLQGMSDPPRPEAIDAVAACRTAGIQVKMITGDHALTASAIAKEVGLEGELVEDGTLRALTGRDLERHDEAVLSDIVERVAVFARVTPEQKLRLVRALQKRKHVVAMTGDGVNDAPALRQANIGVAMGLSGTDVAKEAADMVLTDDNFASIRAAVEEGRGIFDNLTKFLTWTLPTNIGEGLVILTAITLGTELPILPLQILWINMTTGVLLGMMLAFEPMEPNTMRRPPRDPNGPILSRPLIMRMCLVAALMLVFAFGLFEWMMFRGRDTRAATTVAVNVFVFIQIFYMFNCRSLTGSFWRIGVFSNKPLLLGALAMVALQIFFTYAPMMNRLFHTAPIGWIEWMFVVISGIVASAIVGLEKAIRNRSRSTAAHRPRKRRRLA